MNLAIPRENNTELLLYLWKIIDLPYIQVDELLYKVSYDLFLLPPNKARDFVKNCLKDHLLVEDGDGCLRLSTSLNERLLKWQKKRKYEILKKIESTKNQNQLVTRIEKDEKSNFSIFIKSFADKGTINRAVKISDNAFEIQELDTLKGVIKSSILGSKEDSYYIEINLKEKLLRHNCHDFITRKSKTKQFCKHLVKFFLFLKEKFEESAALFFKDLADNTDKWEFET